VNHNFVAKKQYTYFTIQAAAALSATLACNYEMKLLPGFMKDMARYRLCKVSTEGETPVGYCGDMLPANA